MEESGKRMEQLKSYLRRLSEGEILDSVRADFMREFKDVDAVEIMEAEQQMIKEGDADYRGAEALRYSFSPVSRRHAGGENCECETAGGCDISSGRKSRENQETGGDNGASALYADTGK